MKKFVCLLLACLLLMGSTALAEYNTIQWPLVQDGETVKISVVTMRNATYQTIDVNEKWFWKYLEKNSGIDFEITEILSTAKEERMNLLFASGDLPDILMGLGLTTQQLVTYGMVDGMLMDLAPYITEDIMPNLYAWMEAYPLSKAYVTTPDGAIYSLPCYASVERTFGNSGRFYINHEALKAVGKELPKTLDEFTEAMYAIKAANPEATPINGGAQIQHPGFYILNALGYLGQQTNTAGFGLDVAIYQNEVVIPVYTEGFKEYLEIMAQYYKDGIIAEDFFTLDQTTMNARIQEGKMVTYGSFPYVVVPNAADFSQWSAAYPLTSEKNPEAQWLSYNPFKIGGVAVSADAENPELICRFLDFFYSDKGGLSLWCGPQAGTEDTLGITGGWHFLEGATQRTFVDFENGVVSNASYLAYDQHGGMSSAFGNRSHHLGLEAEGVDNLNALVQYVGGQPITEYVYDVNKGDGHARASAVTNVAPYEVEGFPEVIYYSEDDTLAMTDLLAVLQPYIESEVAKFIVGNRSLDEFDAFQEELEKMGIEEYQGYFQDAYAAFLANK